MRRHMPRLGGMGFASLVALVTALILPVAVGATSVPSGVDITPEVARGAIFRSLNPDLPELPSFTAGQASALALSPDGRTLAILTSGFNRNFNDKGAAILAASSEYIFLYDISGAEPRKSQVLSVPNSFLGLSFSPTGEALYATGGVNDTLITFRRNAAGQFSKSDTLALAHGKGLGQGVQPEAAEIAVSPSGRRLIVANLQNDSVTLIDAAKKHILSELDLRPRDRRGQVKPGGTFPNAVTFLGEGAAVVASLRDRELIFLRVSAKGHIAVRARLATDGQPTALVTNRRGNRLYVALDNSDRVGVVDLKTRRWLERIDVQAPPGLLANPLHLGGANPNALALTPDGHTLLVSNGGQNAIAVIALSPRAVGVRSSVVKDDDDGDDDRASPASSRKSKVVGLIPTGWYPTAVAMSHDQKHIYVVNGKSDPGPNIGACRGNPHLTKEACRGANNYVWQLEKAGFLTLPTPDPAELGRLTRQVAENNRYLAKTSAEDAETMAFLRGHIHHVIYIVKENRTYDQVLGDLQPGNGDPSLTLLGSALTPNHHALAHDFVTLDNFLDNGESSNTGWQWSTAGRTNDFTEREAPVNYAVRGLQYDQEGANRNINVGFADLAARKHANPMTPDDPNLLVGTRDVGAPDGPRGRVGRGYIWDAALAKGLSLRNYGFFVDLSRYEARAGAVQIPREHEPWKSGLVVAYVSKPALQPMTDPYFRSFDQAFPDFWRVVEWKREYDGFAEKGSAPALTLLRISHDHFGDFKDAIDGVNTVETQMADNDYALGQVVEAVAKGPFAKDTLIFVVEDDAQDGADHVSAHRSLAYILGPYVRHNAVISKRYTTINLIRTMVDVLGVDPLGLNDALAEPMTQVFDIKAPEWNYQARVPNILYTTALPLPKSTSACLETPRRSADWWSAAMAGQDFSSEDKLDTAKFNRALWLGLRGDTPQPLMRDGKAIAQASAPEANRQVCRTE